MGRRKMDDEERRFRQTMAAKTTGLTSRHLLSAADSEEVTKAADEVNRLVRSSDIGQAKKLLDKHLKNLGEQPRLLKLKQVVLTLEGKYDEARQLGYQCVKGCVRRMLEGNEDYRVHLWTAVGNLGAIEELDANRGSYDLAEVYFLLSHFCLPEHPDSAKNLAGIYSQLGQVEESMKWIEWLIARAEGFGPEQRRELYLTLSEELDLAKVREHSKLKAWLAANRSWLGQ